MRTLSTLLLLTITSLSFGQDWALINPAYRYNYSDDGTDTISNQIRLMDVDTLGVDSIRYTLNLIGAVCDTCPGSPPGGPCDGCFVWVDQPQFLGYDCIRAGGDWHFNGRDTFLLRSDALVGETWPWNPTGITTATVDATWEQEMFGVSDSLRRILLSTGDTVLLSRSFGVMRFPGMLRNYQLIGVEGAGVGRLFPDPLDYFDFQVGDELIYQVTGTCTVGSGNAPPYPGVCSRARQIVITGRSEYPDSIIYSTSVAAGYWPTSNNYPVFWTTSWTFPSNTWKFDRTGILNDHPIIGAYPGQVLDTSICEFPWVSDMNYLACHGLTADGRSVMYAPRLATEGLYQEFHGFNGVQESAPGLHPVYTVLKNLKVQYEQGLGLINVRFDHSPSGVGVELIGAVIGGDTLITPPTITWIVGMDESSPQNMILHPNPADHTCFISGLIGGEQARVFDLEGRMVLTTKLATDRVALDVSGLAPGTYVVNVEGIRPQRLIIAR